MKINSDTINVIESSDELLNQIFSERQRSLQTKKIEPKLELLIKNLLENLRSALDYLANQIAKENACNGNKVSFPIYSQTSDKFQQFMKDKFPNLEKKNTELFEKIESIQYYNNQEGNEWMKTTSHNAISTGILPHPTPPCLQ
ncbi:MAG: hypothetical protein ACREBB_03990 [Nitrosotalea sp.]